MPYPLAHRLSSTLFSALLALTLNTQADQNPATVIVIDDGSSGEFIEGADIVIEGGDAAQDPEITIDANDPVELDGDITIDQGSDTRESQFVPPVSTASSRSTGDFRFGLDEARVEIGYFPDSGSKTDTSAYGHLSASANWQPDPRWEFQLAGRVDGYREDHIDSFSKVQGTYGDSFVRYRGDDVTLTFGSQTVIWGRLDGLPIADRVSTVDLRRFILDELEDSRLSNPMLRIEAPIAGGQLDMVWLWDFRAAELPDKDSVWYPVNRRTGRLLGISRDDIAPAAIEGSVFDEDEPSGDGGFAARYTRVHSFADIGVTVGRTRQSIPYFEPTAPGLFEAKYPRSWVTGADAALEALDATWRFELLYASDTPVTRSDYRYTTTPSVNWGAGVEFHPGDGDMRVIMQLVGTNLIDAPKVLDRTEIYSLNGRVEVPFDRERWRAKFKYYIGLDSKDVYLNPELSFHGLENHEFYIDGHYFDGAEKTFGGFYEDNSSINVGWRTKF